MWYLGCLSQLECPPGIAQSAEGPDWFHGCLNSPYQFSAIQFECFHFLHNMGAFIDRCTFLRLCLSKQLAYVKASSAGFIITVYITSLFTWFEIMDIKIKWICILEDYIVSWTVGNLTVIARLILSPYSVKLLKKLVFPCRY